MEERVAKHKITINESKEDLKAVWKWEGLI